MHIASLIHDSCSSKYDLATVIHASITSRLHYWVQLKTTINLVQNVTFRLCCGLDTGIVHPCRTVLTVCFKVPTLNILGPRDLKDCLLPQLSSQDLSSALTAEVG